jgi:hypothetical protein
MYNNTLYGAYLSVAGLKGANSIYNNLFNNTINAYFSGTAYANNWNTTQQSGTSIFNSSYPYIGGNYWTNSTNNGFSDTCLDCNNDGFCDSSYNLAANNIDYLSIIKQQGYCPDTCTPTANQNWNVACSDNCNESSNFVSVLNLNLTGTGYFNMSNYYINFTNLYMNGSCSLLMDNASGLVKK